MFHPVNHNRPDSFSYGLKLIGEALIQSIRGLGRRSVDTPWSRVRDERERACC